MKVIGTDKNGDEIAEVSVTELDTMFKEIRNMAIDEFAERLKNESPIGLSSRIPPISLREIDEIAEEMRGAV